MPMMHRMFEAYYVRLQRRGVSASTLREYLRTATTFSEWMREQGLEPEQIRRPDIEDFFHSTGWAPNTQRARVAWLRAPWRYAVHELEMLPKSPFDGMRVELPRPPDREPKTIPNRELRAIKRDITGTTDWTLFHLLVYTGMRSLEIRSLTWPDVSLADSQLRFIGKGDRERTIPLHPELQRALVEQGAFYGASPYVIPGQRGKMTRQGLWYKTNQLSQSQDISPHDFRRTFITSLLANGAIEAAVKQIVGHSPGGNITLKFYTAIPQKVLYRELLKVYSDDPL